MGVDLFINFISEYWTHDIRLLKTHILLFIKIKIKNDLSFKIYL